jgi:hypothetical protein
MAHYLHIELASTFELKFCILATPVAKLWLERMAHREPYSLDHPNRFYGFDSRDIEVKRATTQIQQCIDTINDYKKIIDRPFTDIHDQDCLNYLHNIFERYHGLLDQQTHEYWQQSPNSVRRALAELNLAVHRCETVARGNKPRFVCTWFGMPKTQTLAANLIATYGELSPEFGTVCLNYTEIGKTLEDLTQDQDEYIADDAFKPFSHYSADFVVRFFTESTLAVDAKLQRIKDYYNKHIDFFNSRGYNTFNDPALLPYRLPVAKLETDLSQAEIIKQIQQRQHITRVHIQ